jgi:hypothetical protein
MNAELGSFKSVFDAKKSYLFKAVAIEPLVVFRILFGLMMVFSTSRFIYLGWIDEHYIQPIVHFRYFGFSWVPIGPDWVIYTAHGIMLLASFGILIGYKYRTSVFLFFLTFTYTELIDVSYYLNHYYFVSLMAGILFFVPANAYFSVDEKRNKVQEKREVENWVIFIIKFQLFVVYFFAGIAKINADWLLEALPLRIWLPAHDTLPFIGQFLVYPETAFLFSWFGMLFDTTIIFFLLWKRTRLAAYILLVAFHTSTGLLFQIGVFPLVMIASTLIFFEEIFHKQVIEKTRIVVDKIWQKIKPILLKANLIKLPKEIEILACGTPYVQLRERENTFHESLPVSYFMKIEELKEQRIRKHRVNFLLPLYIVFQLLFPIRFLLYSGNVFWTEQGYRFAWRVMLAEKSGSALFYVKDGETGREGVVDNTEFLNSHQEKQMAYQPDMILQYAHFLAGYYEKQGLVNPEIRAEVYVTLNSRPSRLLINPTVDLSKIEDSWINKDWILPLN